MAGYDPRQAVHVPGRLVLGPTQGGLVGSYPYGGTTVGRVARAALVIDEEEWEVLSEAKGKRTATGRGITRAAFTFVLVEYDTTVLNLIYAFTTTSGGGFSGANTLRLPDPARNLSPGLKTAGSPLLFAADNPAHPCVLIHAPFYSHPKGKKVEHGLDRPREEAVLGTAGEDSNGYDISVDLIEHLQL